MANYVYILQSERDNSYYKGYSENPLLRLDYHNKGQSNYTSKKTPCKLVCVLGFETKAAALLAEKKLKKYPVKSLLAVINSDKNILSHYLKRFENR